MPAELFLFLSVLGRSSSGSFSYYCIGILTQSAHPHCSCVLVFLFLHRDSHSNLNPVNLELNMGCLELNLSSSWVVLGCSSGTAIPRGARTPVSAPIGIPICMLTSLKFRVLSTSSTRGVQSLTSAQAEKEVTLNFMDS